MLELLTEKEREALRLVLTCATLGEIARELGVSESAVKQRLASATRKLGVEGRRHKAAQMLAEKEGWPYPIRTGPDRQVEGGDESHFPEPAESAPADRPEQRSGRKGSIIRILARALIRLERTGKRNRLSAGQRLLVILGITLAALLALSMVIATLTETGRFGLHLRAHGHATL